MFVVGLHDRCKMHAIVRNVEVHQIRRKSESLLKNSMVTSISLFIVSQIHHDRSLNQLNPFTLKLLLSYISLSHNFFVIFFRKTYKVWVKHVQRQTFQVQTSMQIHTAKPTRFGQACAQTNLPDLDKHVDKQTYQIWTSMWTNKPSR